MKTCMFPTVVAVLTAVGFQWNTAFAADDSTNRPFLAIWRDSEGYSAPSSKSEAPYLRIAIWNAGRVLYAKDPAKWNQDLLEGRIDAERIKDLKSKIESTGVFDLKGYCYLVPDAPVDCVMLEIGGKQQMLYCDEVETIGYGINITPKEHHLKFKSCWKEVNRLALEAIPPKAQPYGGRFQQPPRSWRLKQPIQSD